MFILVAIGLVGVILTTALTLLDNSRRSANNEVFRDQRYRIIKKTHSFLKSRYIIDYSLNVENNPTTNPDLANCILSAIPATGCPSTLQFPFFEPISSGVSQKIVGDEASPAYTDHFGKACDQTNSNCIFQVHKRCQFACPSGQTVCPTLKVMLCDTEVKLLDQNFLKSIKFKEIQGQFVTSSTIRLLKNPDGTFRYLVTTE